MDADLARLTLLSQHDKIRESLDCCVLLASRFRDGEHVAEALETAVQALRREVEVHIETENTLIRGLLVRGERWGVQLIDRMLVEHGAEHDAMWAMLSGSINDVAPRISELAEELDAHMAAEERTFLAPHVLRADVIERHRP
jgi:iron-sulfur cluster repair protein YtfE (RIC family)